MAQAAKAASVAVSAPYRHYADRDALLAAIAEEGFNRLAARFEAAGPGDQRPERLASIYVGFAVEHPWHFRAMFEGQLDKVKYPELKAAGDRAFGFLIGEAAALVGPEASAGARAIATATLWSVVHGFATIAIENGFSQLDGGLSLRELLRGTIERVVASLSP
jgi:AcrR family transcriptional regulator